MRAARVIVGAAVLVVSTSAAMADSVDVRFVGTGAGRNVRVNLNGDKSRVFAGQLVHEFRNGVGDAAQLQGEKTTFCAELAEHVSRQWHPFDFTDVEDVPNNPGPMGDLKAQAIGALYEYADGRQFESSRSSRNRDFAAAFQVAVWEIINDFDATDESLSLNSGDLKVSGLNSRTRSMINDMFEAVLLSDGSSLSGLRAITNNGYQDQLVLIPLPAPLAMGLAGLALVPIVRRKLRSA